MILKLAYKSIIIILCVTLLTFIFLGDYNLVEGLTMDEELDEFKKLVDVSNKENDNLIKIKEHYIDHDLRRKRQIGIEGFQAEINNNCSTNFSELGLSNNESNRLANIQCEALKTLKGKNKDILSKEFKADYEKYVTKN